MENKNSAVNTLIKKLRNENLIKKMKDYNGKSDAY